MMVFNVPLTIKHAGGISAHLEDRTSDQMLANAPRRLLSQVDICKKAGLIVTY